MQKIFFKKIIPEPQEIIFTKQKGFEIVFLNFLI
jgi:hypothetical protein